LTATFGAMVRLVPRSTVGVGKTTTTTVPVNKQLDWVSVIETVYTVVWDGDANGLAETGLDNPVLGVH